jgi:hypothetical protein
LRIATAIQTPFKVVGKYELRNIPRGTVYSRKYSIERNGYEGPLTVSLADRQARHLQGANGPIVKVPATGSEFEYPIHLPPWMETGRTCRVCVQGTGIVRHVDGTEHLVCFSSREQNDQIIAVVEPELLNVTLDRKTLVVNPDTLATVVVKVSRGNELRGPVRVEVVVPDGLRGITGEPITVATDQDHAEMTFRFTSEAKGPFPAPITVRGVLMKEGSPVTAEAKIQLLGTSR